jgi:hypothetical protein
MYISVHCIYSSPHSRILTSWKRGKVINFQRLNTKRRFWLQLSILYLKVIFIHTSLLFLLKSFTDHVKKMYQLHYENCLENGVPSWYEWSWNCFESCMHACNCLISRPQWNINGWEKMRQTNNRAEERKAEQEVDK